MGSILVSSRSGKASQPGVWGFLESLARGPPRLLRACLSPVSGSVSITSRMPGLMSSLRCLRGGSCRNLWKRPCKLGGGSGGCVCRTGVRGWGPGAGSGSLVVMLTDWPEIVSGGWPYGACRGHAPAPPVAGLGLGQAARGVKVGGLVRMPPHCPRRVQTRWALPWGLRCCFLRSPRGNSCASGCPEDSLRPHWARPLATEGAGLPSGEPKSQR